MKEFLLEWLENTVDAFIFCFPALLIFVSGVIGIYIGTGIHPIAGVAATVLCILVSLGLTATVTDRMGW